MVWFGLRGMLWRDSFDCPSCALCFALGSGVWGTGEAMVFQKMEEAFSQFTEALSSWLFVNATQQTLKLHLQHRGTLLDELDMQILLQRSA